jgi:transcriptional regulator with XRE-family HTH domain
MAELEFNEMSTGAKIKYLRAIFKLSVIELAEALGCTRHAVYHWERGEEPSLAYKIRLSQFFKVPLKTFADMNYEMNERPIGRRAEKKDKLSQK